MKIDRDKMNNANPRQVCNAAMAVVDAMQTRFKPHEQAMGAAAAFLTLAEELNVPAQELFTSTKNLMNGMDGKRVEFAALAAYIRNEL